MRRIRQTDLVLNEPLPWALHDEHGNLLLRQGYVITMQRHVDSLLARGVFVREAGDDDEPMVDGGPLPAKTVQLKDPVFARADSMALSLKRLFALALQDPCRVDFSTHVQTLANHLIEAAQDDPDSLLAASHLDRQNPYRVIQQFLGACLTALLAPAVGIAGQEKVMLVCAALTRDLGLWPMDEALAGAGKTLSDSQRALVNEHSVRSVALLQRQGVTESLWLQWVSQHHERCDGTGYPAKLAGDQLDAGTRLLGLCDSYAAMVIPYPARKPQFPANALRQLFLERETRYDALQVAALFKLLTKYPPGALLKLNTGEIAVIKARPTAPELPPISFVLYDVQGMPMLQPKLCHIVNPEQQVTAMVPVEECRSASLIIKRLWLKPEASKEKETVAAAS